MMTDFIYIFLVMKEKTISGRLANFKRNSWYQVRHQYWIILKSCGLKLKSDNCGLIKNHLYMVKCKGGKKQKIASSVLFMRIPK